MWDTGLWIRYGAGSWEKLKEAAGLKAIAAGDLDRGGKADLAGSWDVGGVWRDSASGAWTRLHGAADLVVSGDFNGQWQDDLAGAWPVVPGTWLRTSEDGEWLKLHDAAPSCLAAGKFHRVE